MASLLEYCFASSNKSSVGNYLITRGSGASKWLTPAKMLETRKIVLRCQTSPPKVTTQTISQGVLMMSRLQDCFMLINKASEKGKTLKKDLGRV